MKTDSPDRVEIPMWERGFFGKLWVLIKLAICLAIVLTVLILFFCLVDRFAGPVGDMIVLLGAAGKSGTHLF
ncbi:hypothetical protein ES705_40527 [subsurface metagenome]